MRFNLAWGEETRPLEVPERNYAGKLEPNEVIPVQDIASQLRQCAAAADEFLRGHHRVLVLVNDYTRPTPNNLALAGLAPLLDARDIRYLVALGTHRPPTDPEFAAVFGLDFLARNRDRIGCHDCDDKSRLFFKGRTTFGTDVWLNRELMWAEAVIAVNSVEPHYFAGFTGGRKTFLPGVAARSTVTANHDMVVREGSATLQLKGNPVHEDMTEAARMVVRPVFSLQFVLDRNHDPFSLYYGDLFASFEAATLDCRAVYSVQLKEQADVVVSVLPAPYDINFYQSQRAVEFALPALRPGGIHVCVSACRDGVGSDHFIKAFAGCRNPADVLALPRERHGFGWHKSARLARILADHELYTAVGAPDESVNAAFMTPFPSPQAALDAALAKLGPDARVLVIPDAGGVVPVLATS